MRTLDEYRQKKTGFELQVFIALTLISLLTLFFSSRDESPEIKNFGLTLFSGVRTGIHSAASFLSGTVLSIRELAELRREHSELLLQITRYEQLERISAEVMQENSRLREQLGFHHKMNYRYIPAQIVGRDPNNLFSAFAISTGTRSGVEVNMPVTAYRGGTQGLVGRVIHAGVFESLVMPLYDSRSFVSSRLSESRFEGIVEGRGSFDVPLLMRHVSRHARDEIFQGDMIITSGIGGLYPPGINIGRVSRIIFDENELSMELELNPSVDFSRLEFLFVIAGETTEEETEETGESDG